MIPVYALLKKHVPTLIDVCRLIEINIYNPIINGQPTVIRYLKRGPSASDSMMGRIEAAVAEGQAERTSPNDGDEAMEGVE